MFIYQILFSVTIQNYGKIVKAANDPLELETIGKIDGDRNFFSAGLV